MVSPIDSNKDIFFSQISTSLHEITKISCSQFHSIVTGIELASVPSYSGSISDS